MRLLAFCFVLALSVAALAELRPLSVKDVSLMLRSGFSSESVLQELEQRRIIDTPDAATAKSLGEFGASAPLLDALETGKFRVSEAAAEKAEKENAAETASVEAQAEKTYRAAAEVLKEQRTSAAAARAAGVPFLPSLDGKLVACHDGTIGPPDAARTQNKKLVLLYFSAHWCAPCRKFTPQFVEFYNRVAPLHPEFEVVFFSFDRSRADWENYLREARMPWLAIDYDELAKLAVLKQAAGDSIPALVLLDGNGRILSNSYAGGKYVGPQKVLADLEKRFAADGAKPVADAR